MNTGNRLVPQVRVGPLDVQPHDILYKVSRHILYSPPRVELRAERDLISSKRGTQNSAAQIPIRRKSRQGVPQTSDILESGEWSNARRHSGGVDSRPS
jgi:hypothetical protein